jgi:ankyrin repeat protein
MFLAATNGGEQMLALLLAAGGDAKAALPTGETVLMSAVRSNRLEAVKKLLSAGADPNAVQKSKGQSALMWAANQQNLEITRALLANNAALDLKSAAGSTALMFAARGGNIELTKLLLDAGEDINASSADGSTPLLIATVRGHADLAQYLLKQGANPDGDAAKAGYTPLHWAVSTGETPISYAGQDAPGEWAAIPRVPDHDKRIALIKALIAHGANIEAKITKGLMAWVAFEERSKRGATPFFTAAAGGDAEVMRLLLALGANPNATASDGSTPMMAVCGNLGLTLPHADHAFVVSEKNRLEAINVAWEAGNDLEAQDSRGYRAMHIASSAGFHELIKYLLAKGADLNPVSKSRKENVFGKMVDIPGQTPLGTAEGYFGGALFVRPQTADFLKSLGARSEGRVDLDNYIDQQRPGDAKSAPAQAAPTGQSGAR